MTHYDSNSQEVKDWKLKMKLRRRLRDISLRLAEISPKIDSGRFQYATTQGYDLKPTGGPNDSN